MFKRIILENLRNWAKKRDRKPLILSGARQVGKTTAVNMFAEEFDQYLSFNLELKRDRDIFEQDLSIPQLLEAMFFLKDEKRGTGKILIFIDEIQNSVQAVNILRYFYEEIPEIHVISAGSLLEVMLDVKKINFPVGRVEFLYMYPLVFEEFLDAIHEKNSSQILSNIPLPDYSHAQLLELFHKYTMLGGMPAVIKNYRENKDINELSSIYEGLLVSYIDDAAKYATNNTMRAVLKHIIETAPFEAGKRIKFENFGQSQYRSREIGDAFRSLERAMLLQIIYPSTSLGLPMTINLKKSPRLQFLDTGLMNYIAGLQKMLFNMNDLTSVFQGTLAEHIVGQQLQALDPKSSKKIAFWVRQKSNASSEVDFLLQHKTLLVPIEVKSGTSGSLKSLHEFIDRSDQNIAIRLYAGKLQLEETKTPKGKSYRLLNLPYFLTGQLHDYLNWLLDLS